jgi:hypothetical protein
MTIRERVSQLEKRLEFIESIEPFNQLDQDLIIANIDGQIQALEWVEADRFTGKIEPINNTTTMSEYNKGSKWIDPKTGDEFINLGGNGSFMKREDFAQKPQEKSTKPFKEHWNQITEYFDFEKVKVAMDATNWTWMGSEEPPTTAQIIEKARELCEEAYTKNSGISTGGFTAEYDKEEGFLSLKFVLTDWNTKHFD